MLKKIISDDWESYRTTNEEEHDYAYNCLTSKRWWSEMELVLIAVSPLYFVLCFADQQKGAVAEPPEITRLRRCLSSTRHYAPRKRVIALVSVGHTPKENPKDPYFSQGSNNENELQYLIHFIHPE